jgi:hypothetical protein
MLIAGDMCLNVISLGDPLGFESLKDGRASQRKLASLSFGAAGFGHGGPIARDAWTRFRNKWGKNHLSDLREACIVLGELTPVLAKTRTRTNVSGRIFERAEIIRGPTLTPILQKSDCRSATPSVDSRQHSGTHP